MVQGFEIAVETNAPKRGGFPEKSGFEPLNKAHVTNDTLEGINNKIKVMKRKAYGFRDDEYFKLPIARIKRLYQRYSGMNIKNTENGTPNVKLLLIRLYLVLFFASITRLYCLYTIKSNKYGNW